MNREEIIRIAKEAGLEQDGDNFFSPKSDPQVDVHITDLEAFAALVASAEREEIAQFIEHDYVRQFERPWRVDLSAAIRARGSHD